MLQKLTDDEKQQIRVMKRVKLMLDPDGAAKGQEWLAEEILRLPEEK